MSNTNGQQEKDGWSSTLYNANSPFAYSKSNTSTILGLLDAKPAKRLLTLAVGQISKARENGLKHAFVADAQDVVYPAELASLKGQFDAVFLNAALHWCKRDPASVIKSAREALRADGKGRFVAELGGFLNGLGLRSVLHTILESRGMDPIKLDPWFVPTVEQYKALLEKGGFQVAHISLNPRITPLPGSVVDWMRTFCRESGLQT
ncbi:hypothetical protein FRB94_004119 [Tulasnella sp. JGI-2019a]|nr:hypothetical protein FRB94_004119 [Tulasnella sp. JGI-2019a]